MRHSSYARQRVYTREGSKRWKMREEKGREVSMELEGEWRYRNVQNVYKRRPQKVVPATARPDPASLRSRRRQRMKCRALSRCAFDR